MFAEILHPELFTGMIPAGGAERLSEAVVKAP
jgi:hypothetical protein